MQTINRLVKCELSSASAMSLAKLLANEPVLKFGCHINVLAKIHWIATQEWLSKEFNFHPTDYKALQPCNCSSIGGLEHRHCI